MTEQANSAPAPSTGAEGGQDTGSAEAEANATVNVNTALGSSTKVGFGDDAPEAPADTGANNNVDLGELGDNPSLAAFKGEDGVFDFTKISQALVDTKALVGQKLGIPGEDSSDEAKAEFHKAMGVPETAEGYEFGEPENLPEELKGIYSEEHSQKWAEKFKEHNVPVEAANALRNEFMEEMKGQIAEIDQDGSQSDEEFDKLAGEIFGDKDKSAELEKVYAILEKHVPEAIRADLKKNSSNMGLLALAAAINGETAGLGKEDTNIDGDNISGDTGTTKEGLRTEMQTLMREPEFDNPFLGKERHDEIQTRLKAIRTQMASMK